MLELRPSVAGLVPVGVCSFYESAMKGWVDIVGGRLVAESSASDGRSRCADGRSVVDCRGCRRRADKILLSLGRVALYSPSTVQDLMAVSLAVD